MSIDLFYVDPKVELGKMAGGRFYLNGGGGNFIVRLTNNWSDEQPFEKMSLFCPENIQIEFNPIY